MSSSSSSISAEAAPPWTELPQEITAAILRKLGAVKILTTAQKVCKTWRRVCRDPSMWRRVNIQRKSVPGLKIPLDMEKMCRHAVDLSQGQLTDITIHGFGSDHLLLYIAQRSSTQLRSLELVSVYGITSCGLGEALKSLGLLEELHFYYTPVGKEDIENIGRSCPLLTSFKLNTPWGCNEEALAIARNMPQLCHLQIIGNSITNEGLEAILDGCPRLESLDLRKCMNVCIAGDLERLLRSREIKDLRLPTDSMDDYLFAVLDGCQSFSYILENNYMEGSLYFLSHSEDDVGMGFNLDSLSDSDLDLLFPFFQNY